MKYGYIIALLCLSFNANAQNRWSLDRCISHAIENNISIKQQLNNIEQNEINLNSAKMNCLPSVDASVSQSWSFGRGLTADNTYANRNTTSTGFDLRTSVTLFQGMQKVNTVGVRQCNLDAAIADLNKAKEDMGVNVASAYLQVLYADELKKVADRQVELSETMLKQKQKMVINGKASESEVAEAKSRLAQDKMSVVQAQNEYNLALLELSQMLELQTPDGFAIEEPDTTAQLLPIASIEEIYADALNNKAIIKSDEKRIESAEKSVSVAKGGYSPSLNLSAGIGSNYYTTSGYPNASFGDQIDQNFNKYVMLSLNIPVFNRFSTRNEVRSAKSQVTSSMLQLDADKKMLYKEVQQAYYNAIAAQSKYGSSLTAEESAETSFKLMSKKYENGKATQTEYNQSRTEWLKTVGERIQAKYEYIFRAKILDFYRGTPLS